MNKRIAKKTEKQNCIYCHGLKSLFWSDRDDKDTVREIYIEQDGSLTVDTNLVDLDDIRERGKDIYQVFEKGRHRNILTGIPVLRVGCNIQINYCPMCGRNLMYSHPKKRGGVRYE